MIDKIKYDEGLVTRYVTDIDNDTVEILDVWDLKHVKCPEVMLSKNYFELKYRCPKSAYDRVKLFLDQSIQDNMEDETKI
jgi:hypothetical protein